MKSENEEFCKSKFDDFIRAKLRYSSIHWDDVAQTDEPPDYFLHLDGIKYAVEVTLLMEKTEAGNLQLPNIAITASLWQLVDEVETNARNDNCLHGAYLVSFSQPVTNFRNIRNQLFSDLLNYVTETQFVRTAPERVIFEHGYQRCTIRKLHDQKNYIGRAGPSGGKWEGEVRDEICDLLEERINSKRQKLSRVAEPKILLLYDAYHFANSEMYKDCVSRVPYLASFHTVFVVQSDSEGFILNSLNTNWM